MAALKPIIGAYCVILVTRWNRNYNIVVISRLDNSKVVIATGGRESISEKYSEMQSQLHKNYNWLPRELFKR